MRNILSALLVVIIMTTSLFAAPLKNVPCVITQPDGTVIHCFVSGDEYFNYYHDAAGYTIIQNRNTGYYTYAVKEGSEVVASSFVVGTVNPETTAALVPNVLMDPSEIRAKREAHERFIEQNRPAGHRTSNTGTMNNIVIFISFANSQGFNSTYSQIDNMLNDTSSSYTHSLKNYYKYASYNQFRIQSHLFPQDSNNIIMSYTDPHPISYFMPESSTNPDGYLDAFGRREREKNLLVNAINYINGMVPMTLDIDNDDDHLVDNVIFIVAADVAGWNDLLWPHRSALAECSAFINGKRVYDYNFMMANSSSYLNVGTFCHEMFHSLSAPDLYDYAYMYSPFVGAWDLMENTQTPPQQMGAYMKYKYGHWISEIPEAVEDGVYTIHSVASSPDCAYKIYPDRINYPHQYLVVEYRDKNHPQDASIYGTGAVIYRVNDQFDGNVSVNYSSVWPEYYTYRAGCVGLAVDPENETPGNIAKSYFNANPPALPEFSEYTDPRPFFSNGSTMPNIRLVDFQSAGDSLTFRLVRHQTVIDTFPWSECFEGNTIPYYCHGEYVYGSTLWKARTGNQNGTIPAAHSGNKNAFFYGTTLGTTKMVLPVFDFSFLSNPTISFWYAMSGTANYTVNVMYKTSENDTWTVLQTINTVASTWTQQTISLPDPSSTYYICFEASGANGTGFILDDIVVSGVPITEFNISASAGEHGQISPEGVVTVPIHGNQTFVISPDNGYTVDQLLVDGDNQGQRLNYTFEDVCAEHSIVASFRLANPSLTVNPTSLIFNAEAGDTSNAKTVYIMPTDITSDIAIHSEGPVLVSTEANPWSHDINMPYNGGMLYVCFAPEMAGSMTSSISVSSGSLQTSIAVTCNATGIGDYATQQMGLYPNPVSDNLQLTFNKDNLPEFIEIFDVCGRQVLSCKIVNDETALNVSHLNAGVYFLKAGQSVKKFIKK